MLFSCSTCFVSLVLCKQHELELFRTVPNLECKLKGALVQELRPNWQTGRGKMLNPEGHLLMAVKGLFLSSFLSVLYLVRITEFMTH